MRFARYWLPVIIYAGTIFYLSSLPAPLGEFYLFPHSDHSDKAIHFFEFAFLGLVLRRALLNASASHFQQRAVIWTIVLGIMYGISDEIHQLFVPGRQSAFTDAFFDAVGILGSIRINLKW